MHSLKRKMVLFSHTICVILNMVLMATAVNTPKELAEIEDDFSPDTFASFNMSKKYEKFNLTSLETLSRRWDGLWYTLFANKQVYSSELNRRACLFLTATYLGAMPEIRKYYKFRYLYADNMEYEIGYLTYNIVQKYQMMIEIYQIMYIKYYSMPHTLAVPVSLIFYMYRNVLELGTTVTHIANMLHEIENKYEGKIGLWEDYPSDEERIKKPKNRTVKSKQAVDDYLKRREEEYKRRQRQRRKDRQLVNKNVALTTPQVRPKKSFWPLHYGWSIEWW